MTGRHAAEDAAPDGGEMEQAAPGGGEMEHAAPDGGELEDAAPDGSELEAAAPAVTRARRRRRVTTDAVPGSDPRPAPEPPRHANAENDARLKADKPPHWG